jgi:hypothetical protein
MRRHAIFWKKRVGESLRRARSKSFIGDSAREYATNVRVEYGNSFAECEGPNGVRRVLAHARQRSKRRRVARHLAPKFVANHPCGAVQCFRTSVITQSLPELESVGERRVRAGSRRGKPCQETAPRLKDPCNLGLLEHDFAYEDRPRIVTPNPRKVSPQSK